MDRIMILNHLAQAERHVVRLRRQRELIDELQRDGHETSVAKDLLRRFEEIQRIHIADRNRLRSELEALAR